MPHLDACLRSGASRCLDSPDVEDELVFHLLDSQLDVSGERLLVPVLDHAVGCLRDQSLLLLVDEDVRHRLGVGVQHRCQEHVDGDEVEAHHEDDEEDRRDVGVDLGQRIQVVVPDHPVEEHEPGGDKGVALPHLVPEDDVEEQGEAVEEQVYDEHEVQVTRLALLQRVAEDVDARQAPHELDDLDGDKEAVRRRYQQEGRVDLRRQLELPEDVHVILHGPSGVPIARDVELLDRLVRDLVSGREGRVKSVGVPEGHRHVRDEVEDGDHRQDQGQRVGDSPDVRQELLGEELLRVPVPPDALPDAVEGVADEKHDEDDVAPVEHHEGRAEIHVWPTSFGDVQGNRLCLQRLLQRACGQQVEGHLAGREHVQVSIVGDPLEDHRRGLRGEPLVVPEHAEDLLALGLRHAEAEDIAAQQLGGAQVRLLPDVSPLRRVRPAQENGDEAGLGVLPRVCEAVAVGGEAVGGEPVVGGLQRLALAPRRRGGDNARGLDREAHKRRGHEAYVPVAQDLNDLLPVQGVRALSDLRLAPVQRFRLGDQALALDAHVVGVESRQDMICPFVHILEGMQLLVGGILGQALVVEDGVEGLPIQRRLRHVVGHLTARLQRHQGDEKGHENNQHDAIHFRVLGLASVDELFVVILVVTTAFAAAHQGTNRGQRNPLEHRREGLDEGFHAPVHHVGDGAAQIEEPGEDLPLELLRHFQEGVLVLDARAHLVVGNIVAAEED
mmetsp:Transcript_43879/g.129929  ORF Transcript_43879/g.129929 Transcript_43879/m.129929 type:complete len:726 (+) Transcript_43879:1213-3390(+)